MTVTLNLPPDVEQVFLAEAQAKGLSFDELVRDVLVARQPSAPAAELSPEEWVREFEEWADSFPDAPPIPDEALSRENLYPDRW